MTHIFHQILAPQLLLVIICSAFLSRSNAFVTSSHLPYKNPDHIIQTIWNGQKLQEEDDISSSIVGIHFDKQDCSGVVIGSKHILTARHCTGGRAGPILNLSYEVVFGKNSNATELILFGVYSHVLDDFDWPSIGINDLAIIELSDQIPSQYKRATLRPNIESLKIGDKITIYGFGITGENTPDQKGKIGIDGIKRRADLEFAGAFNNHRNLALKATESAGCQGDSGGGAFTKSMANGSEQKQLIGVLSTYNLYAGAGNKDDCNLSIMSNYANIGPHIQWISKIVPDAIITQLPPTPSADPDLLSSLPKNFGPAYKLLKTVNTATLKSDFALRELWTAFETESDGKDIYNVIFDGRKSVEDWPKYRKDILRLHRNLQIYQEAYFHIFKSNWIELQDDINTIIKKNEIATQVFSLDFIFPRFCTSYLPLGSESPLILVEPQKINICLDSLAVTNETTLHVVLKKIIWDELLKKEVSPKEIDIVYAWIWTHGLSSYYIKKTFPDKYVDSDPSVSIIKNNPKILKQFLIQFKGAKDKYTFMVTLKYTMYNLIMSYVDVLGQVVIEDQLKNKSASELMSLKQSQYKILIDEAVERLSQ